jgi:hypothetical protein
MVLATNISATPNTVNNCRDQRRDLPTDIHGLNLTGISAYQEYQSLIPETLAGWPKVGNSEKARRTLARLLHPTSAPHPIDKNQFGRIRLR